VVAKAPWRLAEAARSRTRGLVTSCRGVGATIRPQGARTARRRGPKGTRRGTVCSPAHRAPPRGSVASRPEATRDTGPHGR
jgi:hypothetical protein